MSTDLSNLSTQDGYIRFFRKYSRLQSGMDKGKRNWETRETLSRRLRNRGLKMDETMNDEVKAAERLLFPEGELRTYYVANVTMDENIECIASKKYQHTCGHSLETCPLRNLHCRYVTLRPVMTPSLAAQLPKGWTLMARCHVDCPLSLSQGALGIESIYWYPDVPQKEGEVVLTMTPRFQIHPRLNVENMLTAEFLQSLPAPEQSSVKGLQEWQKQIQWRQDILALTTPGVRTVAWKWNREKGEVTIAVISKNEETVRRSGFFQRDAEFIFVPLSASDDPWEWRSKIQAPNTSGLQKRKYIRLNKLIDKKERRNLCLNPKEIGLENCPWSQPYIMTLTFSIDKHPATVFTLDENLREDNAVNTEDEDSGKLNGFLTHSTYADGELLRRLKSNISTVMENGTPDSPELLEYLFNVKKARLPEDNVEKITFFNQNLNPAQQEAVRKMCAVPQIGFLQGPPGTGKTEVIAEIILQHVTQGKRVLVSSQSIVAVDNALERLQRRQDVFPLRLKRTTRKGDEVSMFTLENFGDTYCETVRTPTIKMLQSWEATEVRLTMLQEKLTEYRKLQNRVAQSEMTIQELQNRQEELRQREKQARNDARTQTEEVSQKSYEKDPEILELRQKLHEIQEELCMVNSDEEYDHLQERSIQMNHQLRARRKALQEEESAQGTSELERIQNQIQRLGRQIRAAQEETQVRQETVQNFLHEMHENCFPQEKIPESQMIAHTSNIVKEMKAQLEETREVRKNLEPILREWSNMRPTQHDKDMLREIYPSLSNVVGITCTENSRTLVENVPETYFDLVIIDEVSKATPPELLYPMQLAPKTILVGDHRQLPPIFREKQPDNWDELLQENLEQYGQLDRFSEYRRMVENSLFRTYFEQADNRLKASLTTQYRMHPQIMDIINVFYNNMLSSGLCNPDVERNHGMTLSYLQPNVHVLWVDSSRTPQNALFYEERVGSSYVNKLEVGLIMQMLEDMDAALTTPKTVGIIAFYGKQTHELFNAVKNRKFRHLTCLVSTVDRFQGQECDIILVSMTRNPKYGSIREKSFATSYERINVAFSRARELLVVVGATNAFQNLRVQIPEADGNMKTRKVYSEILENLKFRRPLCFSRSILTPLAWGQKLEEMKGVRK